MRALLLAALLAIATVVPAFADGDGGSSYRPATAPVIEMVGGPTAW